MTPTELAPEPIADVALETPELSPSQLASQGDSLSAYREAKALEKENPELKRPMPADQTPLVEPKTPVEPRTVSKRQQETNERIRLATEKAVADKDAEIARLRAQVATPRPAAVEPPKPAADQGDVYDRYLGMPDAPKIADFQAKGKTYEQFTAAMQIFIADKRDDERTQRQRQHETEQSMRQRESTRATRLQTAFTADTDVSEMFKVIKDTGQYPTNGPISRDVLALKPFSALGPNEQPTAFNAIAEELLESDSPVALARHLSKPGELARLAALPDARSLLRAIRDIEREITTPKTVKTTTQAGEPAITLTSNRATDPLDEETAAIRSGDQARYNEIKREKRLKKAGLLR